MARLGTYLAGTTPFAGDHFVEVFVSGFGMSGGGVPAGVAVGGVLAAGGQSGGFVATELAVRGAVLGAGQAGAQVVGGVLVDCRDLGSSGAAGAALAPALLICAQASGAGASAGQATGYARYKGVGVRVDFIAGGELPQILF